MKSRSREKTRSPPRTGGHSVGAYCGLFAPSRITRSARRKRDKEDEEEVTEEGMVSMAGERAQAAFAVERGRRGKWVSSCLRATWLRLMTKCESTRPGINGGGMTENGTREDWAKGIMARRKNGRIKAREKETGERAASELDSINRSSDEINVLITGLGSHTRSRDTFATGRPLAYDRSV